jgi:hypothetical protein
MIFSKMELIVTFCHNAECHFLIVMLNVIQLSVFMLSTIMVSVVMLSVVMLSTIMVSVVMLSVVKTKRRGDVFTLAKYWFKKTLSEALLVLALWTFRQQTKTSLSSHL